MTEKKKKRNKRSKDVKTKSGVFLTYPRDDPDYAYVRSKGVDYGVKVSRAEAKELGESLLEFSAYKPPPWAPKPGETFTLERRVGEAVCNIISYVRLLKDQPDCPPDSFSVFQISGPSAGGVSSMRLDSPELRPASIAFPRGRRIK